MSDIEESKEFLKMMNEYKTKEVADLLIEESELLDKSDFSKRSGQIKKKGLVKLLLSEYDKQLEELE